MSEFAGRTGKESEINDQINQLLTEFKRTNADIQGQMVVIYPAGVPIANTWEGTVDPILIGAISASVKLTFQHLCDNLKKGIMNRLYMTSEKGKVIVQNTGPKAILCTIMPYNADLLRVAFMASDLAKKIERLLVKYEI